MNDIQKEAEKNLKNFVNDFGERADVLFNILQKATHKNAYSVNAKYTRINIQRKVYTDGTKKLEDKEGYQGGLADGKF